VHEGLTESTFHYWRKCVSAPANQPTALITLPTLDRQAEALEMMTPLGYVIRISSVEQLGWVKSLLEVLRWWGHAAGYGVRHYDVRKSINGLALVVAEMLGHDPASAHWFVFCNRGRDRLKILHWDTNGF
jgi:hypothetical protein